MVFVSFYRIQVEYHTIGWGKLPHYAENFLRRKLVYHADLMTNQQRFYGYGLRLVLVLPEMVNGGMHQYLVEPGFERQGEVIVGGNLLKNLDERIVEYFLGFLVTPRVSGAYLHAIVVELSVQFFLACRMVFLASSNNPDKFWLQDNGVSVPNTEGMQKGLPGCWNLVRHIVFEIIQRFIEIVGHVFN